MAIFKCKMCGGDLNVTEGITVIECEYCGVNQTVSCTDDEKRINLYNRANRLRINGEFDKAAAVYENIVAEFPEEAEAYWGILLCNYGIEYVDDPATAKKVPTCHRSSFDSVMDDNNFELVMEYSDTFSRSIYRQEAKQIEELRKSIIEVSNKEEPYDIFICYKETAENGDRTIDSVIAQDVYNELVNMGYRVFFSRITLEDKLGQEYEPYIFAALNSAKIMLAFGSNYENYNAVWVKNEWSRFLQLIAKGEKKTLIPCYKDIDAYDMPKEFAKLQAQDMGKVGAIQDLLRGIEKILPKDTAKTETVVIRQSASNPTVDSLLERAFMFLEDKEWNNANEYCEKVLDIEPKNARAYLGKTMVDLRVSMCSNLDNSYESRINENANYKKFIKYADDGFKAEIDGYISKVVFDEDEIFSIENNVLLHCYTDSDIVTIPDGVTSISHPFISCLNLKSVIIPNSVISIENFAFSGCRNLTSIMIPDSVTSIGAEAFSDCSSLKTITLSKSVTSIEMGAFRGCSNLTSVIIPDGVTSIGMGAFSGCSSLTSVIIPDSVTSIGSDAFSGCSNLTSVIIPDGVTSIEWRTFEDCSSLKSITLPNGVTSIESDAFKGCSSLDFVNIPASVTNIYDTAFDDDIKLVMNGEEIYFSEIKRVKAEKCVAEEKAERRNQNLCQHCGGRFKGLFTKKCSSCGKEKDY